MDKVFYFKLAEDFTEVGEPVPIVLRDGKADLSGLPEDVRGHLEAFGCPDLLHRDSLYPEDGESFLYGLLRMTNGYWRFRETPEPLA